MWWFLPIVLGMVWLFAILLDFIPAPHAKIIIWIRDEGFRVTRGQLRAEPREFVSEILRQAALKRGFIAITNYDRVSFSRNVPRDIRQRLRNVLLNSP